MSLLRQLRRLRRREEGTTLVELAFVIAIFLLLFFAVLDFGRLSYNWVMAEKAVQMAARMAAVRPPVCSGLPEKNLAGDGNTARFGSACNGAEAVCEAEIDDPVASCSGSSGNATANQIYTSVAGLLPGNAEADNLKFTYTYDPAMNFLGGPYVPVVTVELQNLQFQFASPLLGLARLAGAATTGDKPAPLTFPSMSVSLPGEDLALGQAG